MFHSSYDFIFESPIKSTPYFAAFEGVLLVSAFNSLIHSTHASLNCKCGREKESSKSGSFLSWEARFMAPGSCRASHRATVQEPRDLSGSDYLELRGLDVRVGRAKGGNPTEV